MRCTFEGPKPSPTPSIANLRQAYEAAVEDPLENVPRALHGAHDGGQGCQRALRTLQANSPRAQDFRDLAADFAQLEEELESVMHGMPAEDLALQVEDRRVRLQRGNIVSVTADAIVTAANAALRGGGGVDGAVHAAAGPELLQACHKIGHCPVGSAVLTPAFALQARGIQHVIHAVGPIWHGGTKNEATLLRSAYRAALTLADVQGCQSVALPALSCGVYHYPLPEGARVALEAVAEHLRQSTGSVRQVIFVLREDAVHQAFSSELPALA